MKIDITPIIELGEGTNRIAIDMRNISGLYVFRLANGKDYTTLFSPKELEEFQPSKNVSEMIKEWEDNIKRRHETCVKCIETGLHHTNTTIHKVMKNISLPNGQIIEMPTGETEIRPVVLRKDWIDSYKNEARELAEQFGKISFIKIC